MNLKYYLRGLGLGILVTALILSVAGRNRRTMTDAEVKERAKELGMIENTVLLEKPEETESASETTANTESALETTANTESASETTADSDGEVQIGTDIGNNEDVSQGDLSKEETPKDNQPKEETSEEEKPQKGASQDTEPKDDISQEVTDDPERPEELSKNNTEDTQGENDEKVTSAGEDQSRTDEVTLTIVSGDTSYSVAKKLYELGVVPSVEQTDRFLCANGYDRTIRTGVYTIAPEETLESVAKRINGKK
ncbi:MAG: hypothetical protein PUD77_08755 [Clostridiales bacterium]|nr:hypothetical protein [Clostridiales bacterium]